jgi:hypothetical protein
MKIYQIRLTKEERDIINSGHNMPKYQHKLDTGGWGSADITPNMKYYDHVADLDTDDLNEAFRIGNIGPEARYTRYHAMHSISVGDVLEKADGTQHMVASVGFRQVA